MIKFKEAAFYSAREGFLLTAFSIQ